MVPVRASFAPLMHRLALGFVLMGLALTVGGGEEGNDVLTILGVIALVFGTLATLSAWRRRGWKLGYAGIVVGLIGVIFVGAALDDASCDCRSLIYFGLSMVVIGAGGAVGRARRGNA